MNVKLAEIRAIYEAMQNLEWKEDVVAEFLEALELRLKRLSQL